ncbi:MAG: Sjogren's syndrome/scleroderma autoantigen 1 family protein, partial [Haloferacaceae archaeon]
MSDFDAEAEREKLREKYERDREKREATQRMSELLLKGATMTNKHCDRCGDPIFRYQGQEFCPTCQREQAAQEQAQDAQGQAQAGDRQAQAEGGQQTQ